MLRPIVEVVLPVSVPLQLPNRMRFGAGRNSVGRSQILVSSEKAVRWIGYNIKGDALAIGGGRHENAASGLRFRGPVPLAVKIMNGQRRSGSRQIDCGAA